MATNRLPFLYPHLYRSVRSSESATCGRIVSRWQSQGQSQKEQRRGVIVSETKKQAFVERHGKAVEPLIGPGQGGRKQGVKGGIAEAEGWAERRKGTQKAEESSGTKAIPALAGRSTTGTEGKQTSMRERKPAEKLEEPSSAAPLSAETQAADVFPRDLKPEAGRLQDDRPSLKAKAPPVSDPVKTSTKATKQANPPTAPLETVLQMPPPQSFQAEDETKPPHLQTPPYVHHFDTYTLVQQVEREGFTTKQSITAMKAVRSLLAYNLDVAKQGLVSKSDVENETYLFRAACSELKTEVQKNQRAKDEEMRRDRTHLQHEAEILNQKMTQELLTLKDDLKGMFDDRKMNVRSEQRDMESKIQELNYKITVLLNSDSKSEVEGLRWVLTRRSVMGILFMAFMVLTSLRYASYRSHEDEVRRRRDRDLLVTRVEESAGRDAAVAGNGEARAALEVLAANGG